MNELDLFAAALAVADPTERNALLDRECTGRPALRDRLNQLIDAHAQSYPLLDSPGIDRTRTHGNQTGMEVTEVTGTLIGGRYKLLQSIGEGGMGSVWMADQTEPVKRRVAVKLIRIDRTNSKTVLSRFEAERQAIALMDHPHIAKLLDAGTTDAGQPYFVMELVKGVPLTEFCDANKLSIPERLKLFTQICSAVQHAHQKGIIHRDLKPTNILVESHDDKPVPKVIDFGLAKATSGLQLSEHTLFTGFGTVMGTPLYMAPEQAKFNAVDVDTRADIYALGVILYELLTGTTPLTRDTVKKAALDEMLKLIREQEAPTPSSRLSTSDTKPTVAANRQTEPLKLGRFVKGELDWIVLKALSKERDRRYETANGFAKDIERFINHEPVQAGPPGTGYRIRKFVQRNRLHVVAASLLLFALVAGITGTTYGLIRANRAAEMERIALEAERVANLDAVDQKEKAMRAATAEKVANLQTQTRLKQIEKGNAVLTSIFDDLDIRQVQKGTEPLEAVLAKRLVLAADQLDGVSVGDPLVVAELQHKLGSTLLSLGYPNEAIPLFQKARETWNIKWGGDHPGTLAGMNNLAEAFLDAGKLNLALPLYEETLKLMKAKLGIDHPDTLACMNNVAKSYSFAGKVDKALPIYEENLKLRKAKLGADHPSTLTSMQSLATAYQDAGKFDLALPLHEETLKLMRSKLGADHPDTLTCANNLAECYRLAGRLDLALPLHEETLKLQKAKLGTEHPDTLVSMGGLAADYVYAGKLTLAVPLFETALKATKAKLGADHPSTFTCTGNLAEAYRIAGKIDLALPLLEENLKLRKAKLGADHPETLISMNSLASGYLFARKFELALPLSEETLKRRKDKLGVEHPDTIASMGNLATGYHETGKLDLALPLYEETLRLMKAKLGIDHPDTLSHMNNLAKGYHDAGKPELALQVFKENLNLSKVKLGVDHPQTLARMADLSRAYDQDRQFDKAESLSRERLALLKAKSGGDSPAYSAALAELGLTLLRQKKWTEAEPFTRECLAIREKTQPDHWSTFNTKSMLGGALLGQKKYAEAEPFLLTGYEGLKQREKTIPAQGNTRIPEAIVRLIELYSAMNNHDLEKKWQAERAKYPNVAAKPVGEK